MSQVKLGDVAVESRETYKGDKTGMPIVGLEHITPGEVTLSNWDTDTDNTFTKRFRKGDMLFGRRRAYLKKAAQAPFDGICSGDITVIRAKEDLLLPELLPFIIQNDDLFDFAVDRSAGSLSPRVKWENLKNYPFNLPPIEEQKKLAAVLWSINDTLQAYQKLLDETDELVKSQFIEMFGDLNSVMESPYTVGDVADVQVGIVIKPTRFYSDNDTGTKAFRSLNVGPMTIRDEEWVRFTDEAMVENKRTIAHTGDVLVVRSGYPGTSCVVTPEYDGSNVIDLIIAHPKKEVILPEFLCAFTNYPHGKNQIDNSQRGVAQKHFNVGMYKALKVLVPPMEDQKKFVAVLQQADKSKVALQRSITSLQETKRCLLADTLGRKE